MSPPPSTTSSTPTTSRVRATMRRVDHLAGPLRRVAGPATGPAPEQAAKLVADVDLDRPLGDTDAALEEISRLYLDDAVWFHEPTYAAHLNCPVVIPALLGRAVRLGGQLVAGHLRPERRRHLHRAPARRLDRGAHRLRRRRADGVFTSGGTQSNLQALLLARDRAGRPRRRRRSAGCGSSPRATATSASQKSARAARPGRRRGRRGPHRRRRRMDVGALGAALAELRRRRPGPHGGRRDCGHHRLRRDRPAGPDRRRSARSTASGCTSTRRTAAGCSSRPRRRHLLAGIERADSVTVDYHKTCFQPVSSSALIVRDAGTCGT